MHKIITRDLTILNRVMLKAIAMDAGVILQNGTLDMVLSLFLYGMVIVGFTWRDGEATTGTHGDLIETHAVGKVFKKNIEFIKPFYYFIVK